MPSPFNTIGLIGRQRKDDITDTLLDLKKLLKARQLSIVMDNETASYLPPDTLMTYPREELGKHCDLFIVVGGDGSLLNAARAAITYQTPVLGINRGRLGFLTDIHPTELDDRINDVLDGNFNEEERFFLVTQIEHQEKIVAQDMALNDIVLSPGKIAHMIEFSTSIDGEFMLRQYADGLIVATPTGSTAYALSGGGPILHPQLDAVVLVPMFPHTLTARPIVISGESVIEIEIPGSNETSPFLSCDGQMRIAIPLGSRIYISKKPEKLKLIHPRGYNYFETLRSKFYWGKQ